MLNAADIIQLWDAAQDKDKPIMPRTKQVKKKSSVLNRHKQSTSSNVTLSNSKEVSSTSLTTREYTSTTQFLQEFDIYCNEVIKNHQKGHENARQMVKQMFSNILNDMPDTIKTSNINDNVDETLVGDQNEDPNTFNAHKTRSTRVLELGDFKKPKTPRLGEISQRSSRKRSVRGSATPAHSSDYFKTPMTNSRRLLTSGMTIAPKISDRPMCILRRPAQGEMAISMSGSPLMVGGFSSHDIPTVDVPLQDGRIMSIIPEAGAPPDIPMFDETTMKYLKTLRAHLEFLAPNSP